MVDILRIDGSRGEGGGQILRTSLTLAALTGRPFEIGRIRAGRSKPGLQPQHLTAVRAAARVCQADLEGDAIGSQTLRFVPRGLNPPAELTFDVTEIAPSAGAVSLVFQTVLLPLAYSGGPARLALKGGTDVPHSPPYHYIRHIFLPMAAAMGLRAAYDLEQAGYYPKGGGVVRALIEPVSRLAAARWVERGRKAECSGVIFSSRLPEHVVTRQQVRALRCLKAEGIDLEIATEERPSVGAGTGTFLKFQAGEVLAGFSSLGALGKPAESVVEEACRELIAYRRSGAALDAHLADQLVVPMALASGASAFTTERVTDHLKTNIEVARQWLGGHWKITPLENGAALVETEGIGFTRAEEEKKEAL
ncbi:MAG: RNA 3'-phosphate cyclase [Armatimonadetes bacterium]|nr:RNA 3'-phosphate cyclase [Armatimonadota bacterium]